MNCTKSVVDSSPPHILLPLFMQSSDIAWTVTMAFWGRLTVLLLAIQN